MSRWRLGALGLAATALLTLTLAPHQRLRHLALPTWSDPSTHAATAGHTIGDGAPVHPLELATLPARISAILPRPDGVLFIATFDAGVYRFDPACDRAPVEVGGLAGRERFVDALAEHQGRVIVGTHRGAVVLAPDGQRVGLFGEAEAVAALAVVDDALVLGTAHGLWAGAPPAPLGILGPDGETLRVTALAAAGGRLFVGTADGVYVVSRPLAAQVARWIPLVFGAPAASTNVVTALAPLGDGVLAGTDDGGVVFVDATTVRALPLTSARANDVNPGAMARAGADVWLGSEGAGLLRVSAAGTVTRPIDWRAANVSAVAAGARLFVGGEGGELWSLPPS